MGRGRGKVSIFPLVCGPSFASIAQLLFRNRCHAGSGRAQVANPLARPARPG